jgi:hypothetical protein
MAVRTVGSVGVMKRKKNPGPLVKQAVDAEVASWGPVTPTLRSDLDEPMRLPRPFLDLVSRFGEAKVRYDRGHFSKEQYAQVLAGLVVVWTDGTEWTLGATSGVWYRRFHGLPWVAATPPEGTEEEYDAWQREVAESADDPWSVAVMDPVTEVRDVGRPVAADDPWPVVSDTPSELSLPAFSTENAAIDEHGVWSGTFSALDDPVAELPGAPKAELEAELEAENTWPGDAALGAETAGLGTPSLGMPGVEDPWGGPATADSALPGLADLVDDAPSAPGAFELPAELFGDDQPE